MKTSARAWKGWPAILAAAEVSLHLEINFVTRETLLLLMMCAWETRCQRATSARVNPQILHLQNVAQEEAQAPTPSLSTTALKRQPTCIRIPKWLEGELTSSSKFQGRDPCLVRRTSSMPNHAIKTGPITSEQSYIIVGLVNCIRIDTMFNLANLAFAD